MREIREHCDQLASFPHSGTERLDLGLDMRVTSWKRWVIVFRPILHGIDVLRIVDGSRDWTSLF
jgi:plasmid stabilization system protein ParE